jgi:Archaeal fructose-1,6-bisphosphatase and related enzymes of inositol monophosphatase family
MQPMLNIALRAARSASELIFRSIERLDSIKVDEKEAKDYVSEVDRAAEQSIVNALRKAYPNHSIQGEETGLHAGTGEEGKDYLWIIDPWTAPPTSCVASRTSLSASPANTVAASSTP